MIATEQTARETLDRAVAGLRETGYLEWLENTYRKAAEAPAKELGHAARTWSAEDERRIVFEAVAYMSALLLERELGGYLTQRRLFGRGPDEKRIEAFRESFLRYLPEKLGSLGMAKVLVSANGSTAAHEVSALERIKEYSHGKAGKSAHEHFGACMGRALDPNLEVVANIVALESIPMLVLVIRGALDREFGVPQRPATGRRLITIALALAATLALALAGDFDCFVSNSLGNPLSPERSAGTAAPERLDGALPGASVTPEAIAPP